MSHAAQPEGNPDAIVWQSEPTMQTRSPRSSNPGRLGVRLDPAGTVPPNPPARCGQTALESGLRSRIHAAEHAPCTRRHSRQARTQLRDRPKRIARLYGGPDFAAPSCVAWGPQWRRRSVGRVGARHGCDLPRHINGCILTSVSADTNLYAPRGRTGQAVRLPAPGVRGGSSAHGRRACPAHGSALGRDRRDGLR